MLTYLDSSVLGRAYLADEPGHEQAVALLEDPEVVLVSSSLTRIEVAGLLVRAAKAGRCDRDILLAALDADLGVDGPVTLLFSSAQQAHVERLAFAITSSSGIRALDALHVAVAQVVARALVEPDEPVGFATRDANQADVAIAHGFLCC